MHNVWILLYIFFSFLFELTSLGYWSFHILPVYEGQIGGEGLTNYPIGVGINSNGEILVAENHNNFNLTIFTQVNTLIFYSPVLMYNV